MTVPTRHPQSRGRRRHHDPASRAYAAAPVTYPAHSWRHKMGPVLDQGRISGCTGWSGADLLNSALAIDCRRRYNLQRIQAINPRPRNGGTAHYLGNSDGLALYEAATQNDNLGWTYPPTDNGSTGLGVAKALKKLGVIDQYLWTFDFETMLGWAARQPVMLGTIWTDDMMTPDAYGVLHLGGDAALKQADNDGDGHEYCLIGGDIRARRVRIRNHWTANWGLNGDALISFDDLETLVLGYHGDVCVPELV